MLQQLLPLYVHKSSRHSTASSTHMPPTPASHRYLKLMPLFSSRSPTTSSTLSPSSSSPSSFVDPDRARKVRDAEAVLADIAAAVAFLEQKLDDMYADDEYNEHEMDAIRDVERELALLRAGAGPSSGNGGFGCPKCGVDRETDTQPWTDWKAVAEHLIDRH